MATFTTRWALLLSLLSALSFAIGCPEDDDDATDDDTGDDDSGDDDSGDDDSGDDDTGDDDTGDDDSGDDDSGDDDSGDDDSGDDDSTPMPHALVATVDAMFQGGMLSTVDVYSHAVTTDVASSTSDTWLYSGGGVALALDGYGFDAITAYSAGDYGSSLWQTTMMGGANPRAALVHGGKAYVVLYGATEILIYDVATGAYQSSIDVSPYADPDGNPECAEITYLDGSIYVSCHRLDATWQPDPVGGILLEIDPLTDTVVGSWTAYGGLECHAFPGATKLVCHEGVDFDLGYVNVYEGAIFEFDPSTDSFGPDLLLETTLQANLSRFAFDASGKGLVAAEDGTGCDLLCVDLALGTTSVVAADIGWIVDIEANGMGEAYVLNRSSWSSSYSGPYGVGVYDLATCADLGGGILDVGDEPYKLTFVQ